MNCSFLFAKNLRMYNGLRQVGDPRLPLHYIISSIR